MPGFVCAVEQGRALCGSPGCHRVLCVVLGLLWGAVVPWSAGNRSLGSMGCFWVLCITLRVLWGAMCCSLECYGVQWCHGVE